MPHSQVSNVMFLIFFDLMFMVAVEHSFMRLSWCILHIINDYSVWLPYVVHTIVPTFMAILSVKQSFSTNSLLPLMSLLVIPNVNPKRDCYFAHDSVFRRNTYFRSLWCFCGLVLRGPQGRQATRAAGWSCLLSAADADCLHLWGCRWPAAVCVVPCHLQHPDWSTTWTAAAATVERRRQSSLHEVLPTQVDGVTA